MIIVQFFIIPLKLLLIKTPKVNLDFCLLILVYEICVIPPLFWLCIRWVLAGGERHTVGISRLSLSRRADDFKSSKSHTWSHNESVPCIHFLVSPGNFNICGHLCNEHFFFFFSVSGFCVYRAFFGHTQKTINGLVDCLKNFLEFFIQNCQINLVLL